MSGWPGGAARGKMRTDDESTINCSFLNLGTLVEPIERQGVKGDLFENFENEKINFQLFTFDFWTFIITCTRSDLILHPRGGAKNLSIGRVFKFMKLLK